ncbi:hypothetical protein [Marivita sp.]|uniref:hypothetical protein n=1 Tax=Marivita sp. TaxID=2003365 RepID=UPI003F71E646
MTRIKITHVGSRPRKQKTVEFHVARENGQDHDPDDMVLVPGAVGPDIICAKLCALAEGAKRAFGRV